MKKVIDKRQAGHASTWIAIILVLVGTYVVMTYLPPWYKSWKAKDIIGEVVSGTNAAGASVEVFQRGIVHALNNIGMDIGEGDVSVEIDDDNKRVDIVVTWNAVFNFPLSKRTTTMTFTIKVKRKLI